MTSNQEKLDRYINKKIDEREAKHTPGQASIYILARVIHENSRLLEGESHSLAEALLKAGYGNAAPELLKAAKQMTNLAEYYEPKNGFKREESAALKSARAAIAKAESK